MTIRTTRGAACALLMLGLADAGASDDATPKADDEIAVVAVSGIRRGIEDAISIKKNASSIVEAISAEDIGKLPDNTVAESISRLSGVTTQRNRTNGKATDVSVRGLSPNFNGALLNGREQASTSDARSPEFDLFPSELTGAVVVYKTPDASLMGQGLASTIDLRTLKPLDFGQRVLAAGARKERIGAGSGAEPGSGHRATFSYVDQFDHRRIGVALGLTRFKEDNGGELKFDSWGGGTTDMAYDGGSAKVPSGFLAETTRRKSARDGAALSLQFKPNAAFKSSVDVFYSRGEESNKKTGIEGSVAGSIGPYDPPGVLSDAVVGDGVAHSGTISNYKADVRNHLYSNEDRLLSLGWNSALSLDGRWTLESDLSHSHGVKHLSVFETTAGQPGNVAPGRIGSLSFSGFTGNNFSEVVYKPSLDYADRGVAVLTDVDGWGGGPDSPQAGYLSLPNIDDTVDSVRLDARKELAWGPLAGARFGLNLTRRDKSRTGQEGRLSIKGQDGYGSVTMPGTDTALAGASGIPVASFDPSGTLGTIYELNRWVDATVLARDWSVGEKVTTAYAMGELDGKLFALPYSGNAGVQLVRTRQTASGNQVDLARCTGITLATCPYSVRTDGAGYTNILPSMNVAFDLGREQLLRLGAGKQVSRANLDNMKASMDFSVRSTDGVAPALAGFAGNPRLKPYAARALDLSYEKYFGNKGYLSAGAFYKKLDSYIINAPQAFDFAPYVSANTPLPQSGPYAHSTIGFLTTPQNGQGGTMHGYEFALNVPFSLAARWLDGFGAQANYSYTDSAVRLPTSGFVSPQNGPVFQASVASIGLPGLSKNVGSLRLYYEKHGLQLAWAAHRRSSFVGQVLDYRSDAQFTFIKGETIVDLQASYAFPAGWLGGVSLFLQGHNWTNQPFREFTADPNLITNTVAYGRTYTAGLNVKF